MQQGRYAGRLIGRRVSGKPAAGAFRYFDKGTMAVVGKGFAVAVERGVHLAGFVAWLVWAAVHLQFLGQSSLRGSAKRRGLSERSRCPASSFANRSGQPRTRAKQP
jgi:NADH dehydrogenase